MWKLSWGKWHMLKAKLISPAKLEIMFSTILLETNSEAKSPQSHLEKRGQVGLSEGRGGPLWGKLCENMHLSKNI